MTSPSSLDRTDFDEVGSVEGVRAKVTPCLSFCNSLRVNLLVLTTCQENFGGSSTVQLQSAPREKAARKCKTCGGGGHDKRSCPQACGGSSVPRSGAGSSSSSSPSSSGHSTARPTFSRTGTEDGDTSGGEADSSESGGGEEARQQQQEHLGPLFDPPEDTAAPPPATLSPFADENWKSFGTRKPSTWTLRSSSAKGESLMPPRRAGVQQGARRTPRKNLTPGEYLSLLFTDEVLDRLVVSTSSYVAKHAVPAWTPDKALTTCELKKYFGLLLYMGITQRPDRYMYRTRDVLGDRLVSKVMARDRLEKTTSNLHWTGTLGVPPEDRSAKNIVDSFWTTEGLIEALADHSMKYFKSGRFTPVDEMCVALKGRHRAKVYSPAKPFKWHLEACALSGAKAGYLWNFSM